MVGGCCRRCRRWVLLRPSAPPGRAAAPRAGVPGDAVDAADLLQRPAQAILQPEPQPQHAAFHPSAGPGTARPRQEPLPPETPPTRPESVISFFFFLFFFPALHTERERERDVHVHS